HSAAPLQVPDVSFRRGRHHSSPGRVRDRTPADRVVEGPTGERSADPIRRPTAPHCGKAGNSHDGWAPYTYTGGRGDPVLGRPNRRLCLGDPVRHLLIWPARLSGRLL